MKPANRHELGQNDYEFMTGEPVVDEIVAFLRSDETPSLRGPVMLHFYEDPKNLFEVNLIEWRQSVGKANLEFALKPDGRAQFQDIATVAFTIEIDRKPIGPATMKLLLDNTATEKLDYTAEFLPGAQGAEFDFVRMLLQKVLDTRTSKEQ